MKVSVGLPVHRIDRGEDLVSGDAVAELAVAAEKAGYDAVSVTDHPLPSDKWLARGGHHALDPFSTLAFAAAATTTLRLHTNLLVLPYRNPWLAAHQVATLDRLSGGRVILGVGAGYLKSEFAALGIEFEGRNERTDEGIRIMRRAWAGGSIDGNTMQPTPAQPGGPPIWIGGNSRRAVRRAVELGDGWSPFPSGPPSVAAAARTAPLRGADDLAPLIAYAREHADAVGRTTPLEVVFMPASLTMTGQELTWEADRIVEEAQALAAVGVTGLNVVLPGDSRAEYADELARFAAEVFPHLPGR
ncbi:MAG TPA: TIGR03619 family F420-dependent LLM class oxidoreductase [Acidimicrobiales bacterium]